jgi:hypothetical protein
LMRRAIEKQGGYRTARATLTAPSSRDDRRRRVLSYTRKRHGPPGAAPPSSARFVSLGNTPACGRFLSTPRERRGHGYRQYSAHANQAAHVNRDITRERPPQGFACHRIEKPAFEAATESTTGRRRKVRKIYNC